MTRALLLLAVALATSLYADTARASVLVNTDEIRRYDLPPGFDAGLFNVVDAGQGRTLLYQTVGDLERSHCVIALVTPLRADSFELPASERPNRCVGALAHPQGGFYLRGEWANAQPGEVSGFTAFIDEDGNRLWQLSDVALTTALERAQGGPGIYRGVYIGAHPTMAYNAELDRLVIFSTAEFNLGIDDRRFSQAHVLRANSGEVVINGQTFGSSGASTVGGAAPVIEGFSLFFQLPSGSGSAFFTYDGRETIERFMPLDREWDERIVRAMIYGPGGDTFYLLWNESLSEVQTRISAARSSGSPLWQKSYATETELLDTQLELGPALGMWVGSEYILLLYLPENLPVLRVIEARTGSTLGVTVLNFQETDEVPQAIVTGPEGDLRLLAIDTQDNELIEYELDIDDLPDVPILGGSDSDQDIGPGTPLEEESSCGCRSVAPRPRGPYAALVLGAAALVALRRRRAVIVKPPCGD